MLSVGAYEGGLLREKQLEAQLTQTGAHREDSLLTSLPRDNLFLTIEVISMVKSFAGRQMTFNIHFHSSSVIDYFTVTAPCSENNSTRRKRLTTNSCEI